MLFSVHCHNDLGLATANAKAGIMAGARRVECTVNGIGERAGNTSLEEIVMLLRVRKARLGFETGVNWTLGLPFIRTSPDHGTAYDIAGRDQADPSSMRAAIRLAKQLARART